jgi:hypothetical protein
MPPVLIRVPFVPSGYGFEDVDVMLRYDAGDDEGLLPMEWVGVSKVDAKYAQQGSRDIPRGL